MNLDIVEIHALAEGTVQGIGFRYTTQRLALSLQLQGSVQNLADGSVEIYAQGPKEAIQLFCEKLNSHWKGYMQPLTPTYLQTLHTYEGFVVKK